MIKVKEGQVAYEGSLIAILADLSCIVFELYELADKEGIDKEIIDEAIRLGKMSEEELNKESEKLLESREESIEKLKKLMSGFFDFLGGKTNEKPTE